MTVTTARWTPEQQAEHRAQWVAALRSGDYKQGTGALSYATDDGTAHYCCLGVACELAVEAGVITSETHTSGIVYYADGQSAVLPREVADWLGLESREGYLKDGSAVVSLVDANDGEGLSFDGIATIIERGDVKLAGE